MNLTSRIQACTTGGQILVSETTRQELGNKLKIGKQMEVRAKGVEHPVVLFEVLGIGGRHKLSLAETADTLVDLEEEIPLLYEVVESSQVGGALSKGVLTKVSLKAAEARLAERASPLEQSQDASHPEATAPRFPALFTARCSGHSRGQARASPFALPRSHRRSTPSCMV